MLLASLLAALLLALVHVATPSLRFLEGTPRSVWLSLAGGVSVAYVFVHFLRGVAHGHIRQCQGGGAAPVDACRAAQGEVLAGGEVRPLPHQPGQHLPPQTMTAAPAAAARPTASARTEARMAAIALITRMLTSPCHDRCRPGDGQSRGAGRVAAGCRQGDPRDGGRPDVLGMQGHAPETRHPAPQPLEGTTMASIRNLALSALLAMTVAAAAPALAQSGGQQQPPAQGGTAQGEVTGALPPQSLPAQREGAIGQKPEAVRQGGGQGPAAQAGASPDGELPAGSLPEKRAGAIGKSPDPVVQGGGGKAAEGQGRKDGK